MKNHIQPQLLNAKQAMIFLGMGKTRFYSEVNKGLIKQHRTPARNGQPAKTAQYFVGDLNEYIMSNLSPSPDANVRSQIACSIQNRGEN